eukprot:CAMPEP_0115714058 /NCGR_PEP_ID=MMETSP0272-20121206/75015_1 /TAXON_ID=71861 /ORGANISM="Scrippsiella trochoidea, Strain CCMP3099" /LENGTH=52 /DNA_ID=CAMNT_0003156135 /DNA_START=10 /DNA_END=164 /DNA_ORIENTATION=+
MRPAKVKNKQTAPAQVSAHNLLLASRELIGGACSSRRSAASSAVSASLLAAA